jgi:hypothetical protein
MERQRRGRRETQKMGDRGREKKRQRDGGDGR